MMMSQNDDAIAAAQELLRSVGLTEPPIDTLLVAQYCGLRVNYWEHCPPAVSGLLYRGPYRVEISVNARQPITRRRYTIGHEIAHWVFDDHLVTMLMDDEGDHTDQEQNANAFSAELLMPEAWLRRDYARLSFRQLRERYGVSKQALDHRLCALGLETKRLASNW